MNGIVPMAVITMLASLALYGGIIFLMSGRQRSFLWLLLPGLPLSFLINKLVKGPLMALVAQAAGIPLTVTADSPIWWLLFLLFVAPVTEEAVKVLPLVIPSIRRMLAKPGGALWTGFTLGISFGLGEVLYLAYNVARAQAYAGYPWYAFTGFLTERLMAVFVHGVMTAVFVTGIAQGWRRGLLHYLFAVILHALVNLGAMLFQMGLIDGLASLISLVVMVVVLALIFERMRRRASAAIPKEEVVLFER